MIKIAFKMLFGDRGKYLGIITGIAMASVLMIQQLGILLSILNTVYGYITDIALPQIWVMDPKVQTIDDSKPMLDTQLYRVRGIEGVEWAVPLYKGNQKVRLANGETVNSIIVGLDDSTLIGGPPVMVEGKLADLRLPDAIIVDETGAKGRLATPSGKKGEPATPLKIGDILEINDVRAKVVGFARTTNTFQSQPVIYTTYTRAKTFSLDERKLLTFILAQPKSGESASIVAARIAKQTGLGAHTAQDFKKISLQYVFDNTSIVVNFGFVVVVGFIVGAAVPGQIFYNFTLDNLRYFGVFKAMGATNRLVLTMILLQALLVGFVGFGIGAGATALFARATQGSGGLSMRITAPLLLGSGGAVLFIVLLAALISARKVIKLEPAVVFKG